MIFGYARVSTVDQNLDAQISELEKYGIDKLYQEKASGVSLERKEFNKLMKEVQAGDTVVVARMDRLARSLKQLVDIVEEFQERDVQLVTLDYQFDTRTPTGKMLFHIIAAVSEWERSMLKERQRIGIAEAKKRNKHLGRPPGPTSAGLRSPRMQHAIELYQQGEMSVKEILKKTGVSKSSLYRRLNELKAEGKL